MTRPISTPPVSVAKRVAKTYDLDQVIVIGRDTGDEGYNTFTSYGRNRQHCNAAARIAEKLIELFEVDGRSPQREFHAVRDAVRRGDGGI